MLIFFIVCGQMTQEQNLPCLMTGDFMYMLICVIISNAVCLPCSLTFGPLSARFLCRL